MVRRVSGRSWLSWVFLPRDQVVQLIQEVGVRARQSKHFTYQSS